LVPAIEGAPCDTPGDVCPEGYLCNGGFCHSTGGTGGGTGMGGGSGGGGTNLCMGVTCDKPPAASCKDPQTLTTYTGQCSPQSGTCNYSPMDTHCTNGCMNGQCVGEMCAGIVCNQPPAPKCNGNAVVTSAAMGSCTTGTCTYPQTSMDCGSRGCADGACIGLGQTFTQVLPRVRHAVNAIDQAPGSMGANVVVVGPGGALTVWNGTSWTPAPVLSAAGDLTSVWFPTATTAYVASTRSLLRWNGTALSPVNGFPSLTMSGKPVDVHGRAENDYVVVDDNATVYRFNGGTWTTTSQPSLSGPYDARGIFQDAAGHIAVYGACNGMECVAFSNTGTSYSVRTNNSGVFTALGPSLDTNTTTHTYLWAGGASEAVARFDSGAALFFFDSTDVPTLSGGDSTVLGIVGGGSAATSRFNWVLTGNGTSSYGTLYRISGTPSAPIVDTLSNAFYNVQHFNKNDSAGVVFSDTDTTGGGTTIVHRSVTVDEALDLGAESWVSIAPAGTGFVMLNKYGDVAASLGAPTFQLHRTTSAMTPLRVAAGPASALFVGSASNSALAQLVPLTVGSTYVDLTVPNAPTSLNGVCRVSDTEWYLVGNFGSIYTFDGNSLTEMTNPATENLQDVDCAGPGVAVACGDNGTLMRLTNGTWANVAGAPSGNLTSCRFVGGALYVAGDGIFAKAQNSQWATLAAMPTLTGLVGVSATELYAASGTQIFRFNGSAWQMTATAPQTLAAGALVGSHVMFAGPAGVVMEGQ
jgi:hypothetical protein